MHFNVFIVPHFWPWWRLISFKLCPGMLLALAFANDFPSLVLSMIISFMKRLLEHSSKIRDLFLVRVWSARRP